MKQGGNLNAPRNYGRREYNTLYFHNISTEEQAYWLGIIWADGYVSAKARCVSIGLAAGDIDHLVKLAATLGLDRTAVRRYASTHENWQDTAELHFGRHEFLQAFIDLGYATRKPLRVAFPAIPRHLLRHFIRGMFDGDGHVSLCEKEGKRQPLLQVLWSISIANLKLAKLFRTTIENAINRQLGISPDHRIWRVQSANPEVLLKLYEYLYAGATVWLERKRKRFEACRLAIGRHRKLPLAA